MSEPDFGQIPAHLAGCADPGWDRKVDRETGTVRFTHEMWPDHRPRVVYVKCDHGRWREVPLEVGEVTSNTDVCKAHAVGFTVRARNIVLLRLRDPLTDEVLSTEWFRYLDHAGREQAKNQ